MNKNKITATYNNGFSLTIETDSDTVSIPDIGIVSFDKKETETKPEEVWYAIIRSYPTPIPAIKAVRAASGKETTNGFVPTLGLKDAKDAVENKTKFPVMQEYSDVFQSKCKEHGIVYEYV